ncbi:MAG: tetratricopeptide repeat protein [Magnetococcus sp. YQC-5]
MTWIWILPVILTIALAGVFYPVFTRRGGLPLPAGLEGDVRLELASQRDGILMQLKEMELDAGATDPLTATNRAELEQELALVLTRLDATANKQATVPSVITAPRSPVDISIAFSSMLLVAVLTGGSYLFLGTPEEIAPGVESKVVPAEFAAMVDQAAQKLQATPDDLPAWMRLARSYMVLNRLDDAMKAYTHILTRHPDALDAAVGLATLHMQSDNPQLHVQGIKRFEGILARQPDQPEALWFLGGAAFRAGDRDKALVLWRRLQPLLQPGTPARKTVDQAILEIGKK